MNNISFNLDLLDLETARRYHLKNFPIYGASRYTVDEDYYDYILGVACAKMEHKQSEQVRRMGLRYGWQDY